MPRDAGLLGEDGDLAERLDDHAEHGVVRDLPDPRQFALAHVGGAAAEHLEVGLGQLKKLLRPRCHHPQQAGLRHLAVAGHRCAEVAHAEFLALRADFGRSVVRDRRAVDYDLGMLLSRQQTALAEQHLLQVRGGRHHGEDDVAGAKLGYLAGDLRAVLRQRLGLRASAVPHRHVALRLEQARGHRVAHAPHADPADLLP